MVKIKYGEGVDQLCNMFPEIDKGTIEALLKKNKLSLDNTVEALLKMKPQDLRSNQNKNENQESDSLYFDSVSQHPGMHQESNENDVGGDTESIRFYNLQFRDEKLAKQQQEKEDRKYALALQKAYQQKMEYMQFQNSMAAYNQPRQNAQEAVSSDSSDSDEEEEEEESKKNQPKKPKVTISQKLKNFFGIGKKKNKQEDKSKNSKNEKKSQPKEDKKKNVEQPQKNYKEDEKSKVASSQLGNSNQPQKSELNIKKESSLNIHQHNDHAKNADINQHPNENKKEAIVLKDFSDEECKMDDINEFSGDEEKKNPQNHEVSNNYDKLKEDDISFDFQE